MKKIFTLIFIFTISFQFADAQSRKAYELAADEAVAANDYSAAMGYYDILLEEAKYEDLSTYYKAAEAAYGFNLFNRAEKYFQWAIDNGGYEKYPTLDFQLALTKKRLGNYSGAITLFEKYRSEHASATDGTVAQAADEIETCEWAIGVVNNRIVDVNTPLAVKDTAQFVEHLDSTVNTWYTDLAPMSRGDRLYYSSVRYFAGEDAAPFARILASENGQMSAPVSGLGGGNNQSTANSAFNADGSRIYFSICDKKSNGKFHCELYYRDRDGDSWGSANKLPGTINSDKFTATQPAVGVDMNTGEELFFFVSDRDGGKGGLDIWCSNISADGQIGAPYNVEEINTKSDDITPYFHSKKNTLFYSSNGRQSLGGFDIYKSEKDGKNWSAATHTGYPLNSSYDEVYMSLNEGGDRAYFSSNRLGGMCKDPTIYECVCDDIYAVNVPYIELIVETYNKLTQKKLTQTTVSLQTNQETPDIKGPTAEYKYGYELDFNKGYKVIGTKKDYLPDNTEFDTFDETESGTIVKKLYLTPAIDVIAYTYDKVDGTPLFGATVKLVQETTIKTIESKVDANKDRYDYGLNFDNRYLLIATKPGYTSDTVEVFTDNIEKVPTHWERDLFLCRKPFDPNPQIVLYFDNDFPKKLRAKSKEGYYYIAGKTASNYQDVYQDYVAQKRKDQYSNAFETAEEKAEVSNFFSDVESNFTRLQGFAANLYTYLSDPSINDDVIVTIKGYASPLAKSNYNKKLTERRIFSIRKYLEEYEGGKLVPYMAQVKIRPEAYGEETAKGGSDDRSNQKASVYSIDASRERRVEIINISTSQIVCPKDKPAPKKEY